MYDWAEEEEKSLQHLRIKEFHPQQYLWLFNSELKFSERENFNPEGDLSTQDYNAMVDHNRKKLTIFLKKATKTSDSLAMLDFN